MPKSLKTKYTKLSWLEVQLESQKWSLCLVTFSMEENQTDQSTLMKLLLMVLLSKVLSSQDKVVRKFKKFFYLMLSLFLLVLRPLEVSWPNSLKETPLSLLKNNKFSQPTPITNLVSWSKSMKEKDNLLKTTTYSVNSILTEFHQLQEELHKLKSPSMLMPMVLWILLLPIKVVEKLIISLSPTKKVDSVKTILKNSSKKLNNSKLKTTLSRKRSKLKMDSNTTATLSNKLLTMKNSKANSTTNKKRPLEEKLMKSSNGWKTMLMLNSKNTKPNKKNLKLFGTQ